MLAIGAAAGAASFTHVRNVAASHGQDGWLGWADAVVLELMSIAAGLEIRRRKRHHTSAAFPVAVLICAVALSIAAQVVEADASVIGWIAAALPAAGFLVMVKIAMGHAPVAHPSTTDRTTGAASRPDVSRSSLAVPASSVTAPTASSSPSRRSARDRPRRGIDGDDHVHNASGRESAGRPRSERVPSAGAVEPDTAGELLLTAAREILTRLVSEGRPLTRDTLADQLRLDGHAVRNSRVSELLAHLRQEQIETGNLGNH
ncbi:DUF2637 domain-containing protein [Micromonospora echinaurantiaca]|uniref:DUF2637 domain-containing protein n=1 Tax=Micromonospora echinaurantiaca TaxID=47857 RepID=UPI0037B3B8B8